MRGVFVVNGAVGMSLFLSAVCGDKLVQVCDRQPILKALFDNLTHAVIGGLTWIGVVVNQKLEMTSSGRSIAETLLCSMIASGIDIDHFVTSHSFHLKDAVSLSNRPFLHTTSVPIFISSVLFLIAYFCELYAIERLSWIVLAAFLSHHIRDAARRGLWLWPFGSTPPLGVPLYLILITLFPVCQSIFMNNVHFTSKKPLSVSIV